jgi:hypothetical protein
MRVAVKKSGNRTAVRIPTASRSGGNRPSSNRSPELPIRGAIGRRPSQRRAGGSGHVRAKIGALIGLT